MKIKMNTLSADPDGVMLPGKTYDVSETEAKELVQRSYAQYVDAQPVAPPADNSYDAESGELIGYCSIVPATEGEEHMFGDVVYIFDREEEGLLYFSKLKDWNLLQYKVLPTLEVFSGLKADEQKAILTGLKIEGDDGNEEKRSALFTAYLEANK